MKRFLLFGLLILVLFACGKHKTEKLDEDISEVETLPDTFVVRLEADSVFLGLWEHLYSGDTVRISACIISFDSVTTVFILTDGDRWEKNEFFRHWRILK